MQVAATVTLRTALPTRCRRSPVVAVIAQGAPAYARSLDAQRLVEAPVDTIADGMACRIPNADALALFIERGVRYVVVSDGEIGAAMRLYFVHTHNVAEGAGAASLAAALKDRGARGARVGIVLSGGNVDRETYLRVLEHNAGLSV
jgi:threonine dehydratase